MSFLNDIKTQLIGFKEVIGIHIHLDSTSTTINSVHVVNEKGELKIKETQNWTSLDELKTSLPANSPIGIHFSGKGILLKTLPTITKNVQVINKILPNANEDDFHMQHLHGQEISHYGLIRKEVIEHWLAEFSTHFVVTIQVGLHAMYPTLSLLSIPFNTLKNYKVEENENKLVDITELPQDKLALVPIGDQELSELQLPAFSVAIKTLLSIDEATLPVEILHENKDEYSQRKIFQLSGIGLLSITLLILIINYIVLQGIHSENDLLLYKSSKYTSMNQQADSLKNLLEDRKSFITSAGWMTNSSFSKWMDQLGASLPKELLLNTMEFHPKDHKRSKKEKQLIFNKNTIYIMGESSRTISLNTWVNTIKQHSWVDNIKIVDYNYDSKKKVGLFELSIQTK